VPLLFVGDDWAEDYHDIEILDEAGRRLAKRRLPEGLAGLSIDMRRRPVEETADLLTLGNVELTGHHARIRGTLGTYSVQLGSGQVRRIPGNAVCIIPVSAQRRGWIFLPVADEHAPLK
jgi:hypothetical protein